MAKTKGEFKERLDADSGFKSKKRMLTVVSLLLLGKTLSGAEVVEANTLIFNIKFASQGGISTLLLISVFFLFVRYHNYAYTYHDELRSLWLSRMIKEPFFYCFNPYEIEGYGLVVELEPGNSLEHPSTNHEEICDYRYACKFPLRRYIVYSWQHDEVESESYVNIIRKAGLRKYLVTLYCEFKCRIEGFWKHREHLDLFAPYIMSIAAICSYFFTDKFHAVVEIIEKVAAN